MNIQIKGAQENNLNDIDVEISDGLTAVTGISGSGKTSLVFDTIYHETRRRFLEQFASSSRSIRLNPAKVNSIKGLSPAIAVGQNLLNRNPNSTLATASGIHPLLRLLFARFGERRCQNCNAIVINYSEDDMINIILKEIQSNVIELFAQLVKSSYGTHKSLLTFLSNEFGTNLIVDGIQWSNQKIEHNLPHDIDVKIIDLSKKNTISEIRVAFNLIKSLGTHYIKINRGGKSQTYSFTNSCGNCGTYLPQVKPKHFNLNCPYCKGKGCQRCSNTGMLPLVSKVTFGNYTFPEILNLSVERLYALIKSEELPPSSERLVSEIKKRLNALKNVGLNYLTLNRSSPTLSRGEAQRVRIALTLVSELEDILHILDEPTIGQHPYDVRKFLPNLRDLKGSVIYVEHDKLAVSIADNVIDLGPGAGHNGGNITFIGTPQDLWLSNTITGKYLSSRIKVKISKPKFDPTKFIMIEAAHQHNLKKIDVQIPIQCVTVVTGVSGSGKSSLVEDVLYHSLKEGKTIGCKKISGQKLKPIMVDQSPIGRNPRSNPATYTKIADIFRRLYEAETNLTSSHYSFNRPEGACPTCNGMGSIEVKMRYLPSTWIPCGDCNQTRFKDEILENKISIGKRMFSIAELYELTISEVKDLFKSESRLSPADRNNLMKMLDILVEIGLGYLSLGQSSPSLSGGEAQRIKLAKYLGKNDLSDHLIILDEPSTGLHSNDIQKLLAIFSRLTAEGATILIVEHNIDIIRAADWIVDIGPNSGNDGGQLIFSGKYQDFLNFKGHSFTHEALIKDDEIKPSHLEEKKYSRDFISIKNARANNLKNIDVEIPKNKITTVTGVSGSGKSSLVIDIIETEARRKFLETLSMYERQGTREGGEAQVDYISGLGITSSISPLQELYFARFKLRNTVGNVTEISYYLSNLLAFQGEMKCPKCGTLTHRKSKLFECPNCNFTMKIPKPSHFHSSSYIGACTTCHGIGTIIKPKPEKLIINPDKPICKGAMYSPGFFPKGYLCKPYNGGYYMLQALAKHHKFDPFTTPWKNMSKEAQEEFLHGSTEKLKVIYENRKGDVYEKLEKFPGFYEGYVRDWDIGGTYTESVPCPYCNGAKLKQNYLLITFGGFNIHEFSEMPLFKLSKELKFPTPGIESNDFVKTSLDIIINRLNFLIQTGLGYIKLNRVVDSLSAGEAQRIRLAGFLGSELSSLTILLDEPSRGLHPTELAGLQKALEELRDKGNTVIIVEHDMQLIKNSDYLIDMGPGAGTQGGFITAKGKPSDFMNKDTLTAKWMRGELKFTVKPKLVSPKKWLEIIGATENNLKGDLIQIPHNCLVGICGVSGSGKSTLIIDTLGRALSPKQHTTSVAYEPIPPGKYEKIKGKLSNTVLIDQAKENVKRPLKFLKLDKDLVTIYAGSEEAQLRGYTEKILNKKCATCRGKGIIKTDMGFLPDIIDECEVCEGTGYAQESWEIKINGYSLPELNNLTFYEIFESFGDFDPIKHKINLLNKVGLGYLVLNQPIYTLSGGEVQRLKIVKELMKKTNKKTLYILDEPTVGQHLEDISRLIKVLRELVQQGHTVVVVEHHSPFLASCDWLIELGPVGGPEGGHIIASGPPSEIANLNTPTAPYIKEILEGPR